MFSFPYVSGALPLDREPSSTLSTIQKELLEQIEEADVRLCIIGFNFA